MATIGPFEMTRNAIQIFILFVICLRGVHCAAGGQHFDRNRLLASVREYPFFLHRCMATFVSPISLVTTATCLVCPRKCHLLIRVLDSALVNAASPPNQVRKVVLHPQFRGKDSSNNIGIIILSRRVSRVKTLLLPDEDYNFSGIPAFVYTWRLTEANTKFLSKRTELITISNEMCSTYLHKYTEYNYMCVLANSTLTMGKFQIGSPIISQGSTLLGIYSQERQLHSEIVRYQSIIPYVSWIRQYIKKSQATTRQP